MKITNYKMLCIVFLLCGGLIGSTITYLIFSTYVLSFVEYSCVNGAYISQAVHIQRQVKSLSLLQSGKKEQAIENMGLELAVDIYTMILMYVNTRNELDTMLYESTEKNIFDAIEQSKSYITKYPLPFVHVEANKILAEIKENGAKYLKEASHIKISPPEDTGSMEAVPID